MEKVFDIHIGQSAVDSSVTMNGEDISAQVRGVSVEAGDGELTRVTLRTIPSTAVCDVQGTYMPVPRCDSCRWWKAHVPNVGYFGDCALFECHEKEQVERTSKVVVSRTGSGEATIITVRDFGCVQWDKKT